MDSPIRWQVGAGSKRRVSVFLSVIIALTFLPAAVFAHDVHVHAHAHGTSIHGTASYRDETPVRDATVTALDPAGEEIGRTTTDQKGKFTLKARFRCDHRLLVDTGDGHGAEDVVRAAELPKSLPARGNLPTPAGADEQLEAIRSQLEQLESQLDEYERRTRLRDVLGGIGYILGIAGVAFYLLGTRRRARSGEG